MKKAFTLLVTLTIMNSAMGVTTPPHNANYIQVRIGVSGTISLMELSKMSYSKYLEVSGQKGSIFLRFSFNKGQKLLRKAIAPGGEINEKLYSNLGLYFDGESGFHLGGFLLGFFLGPLGILLTYVAWNDDYRKNRRRWALSGFGVSLALLILLATLAAK